MVERVKLELTVLVLPFVSTFPMRFQGGLSPCSSPGEKRPSLLLLDLVYSCRSGVAGRSVTSQKIDLQRKEVSQNLLENQQVQHAVRVIPHHSRLHICFDILLPW